MSDFDNYVEDIYTALGGIVDRETIARELKKLLDMKVPITEARNTVITRFGGNPMGMPVDKKVAEIVGNERSVNMRLKILSVNSREYEGKDGRRIMYYGIVGDETGTIPFTAWRADIAFQKGDSIEVRNAYAREWQGKPQLVFGNNTRIQLLSEDIKVKSTVREAKVVELKPNMGLVDVRVKVVESTKKEVEVGGNKREISEGIVGDETGKIPFTAWDMDIHQGDILHISGAYVRPFRGLPQLVFDNRALVEKLDEDIEVNEIPVPIENLEGRGGYNVLVEGIVIDVKDRSGLIYRCPECGRVLSSTICPEHGRVTPKPDLRIKAVLDDGTGGMVCIFDRAQTEKILGFGIDEALKKIQENFGNAGVIKDIIEEKLIAMPLRVRGNVISKEKYGLTMLVKDFEILDVKEIAKKAEKMLEEMGW